MSDRKGSIFASADIAALHKEWDELSCPICMDHPHNAVLFICTSHDKGCRSYICDTSYRHSNCLDRYKKLKMHNVDNTSEQASSLIENPYNRNIEQINSVAFEPNTLSFFETVEDGNSDQNINGLSTSSSQPVVADNNQGPEIQADEMTIPAEPNCLKCPLCRGTVIGWKIMKDARQYLDEKPRICSRESCLFSGSYRELRRHARRIHPKTRPADVDPSRQSAWCRLEHQREYGDILSAVRTAMPGAIVVGDYVIENGDGFLRGRNRDNNRPSETGRSWWATYFLVHMINPQDRGLNEPRGSSRGVRIHRRSGHQNLWRDRLLERQHDAEDLDDEIHIPRRRRRIRRSRTDEQE